ncbi:hypothetical protein F8A87_10755 [Betaproteobacteria bacterium SCN2]|jgi:hypothetical protein|nr:hypothetical protein F8A87_10755 [Betaproteobacteria bacterium SCN2]
MSGFVTTQLVACIERYQNHIPALAEIGRQLQSGADPLALYEQCHPLLEQAMWSGTMDFHALLADYQALFREQEALIQQRGNDGRHHFILGIPIADRPPHLRACLESIHQLCRLFNYGGNTDGAWDKVEVVVAEDSRFESNIRRDIELVEEYRQKGLQVHHFGLDEQYELLHALPAGTRERLGRLLTTQTRDKFYLKGQAANRNLAYLKFLQLTQDKDRTLYYLVDSDQRLCVNRQTEDGEEAVYALNYFSAADRIFRSGDTLMLTGKMVGDPPVSPSVMAASFLNDVSAFFTRLAGLNESQPCQFHGAQQKPGDAAYHDLAGLFGYEHKQAAFDYACRLEGSHDHAACLRDFSSRLNAFFFGEHLTRRTWFDYGKGYSVLSPARTIYPGNYIVNYAGLKYVIPFGHLRLRMSGPTSGRLIAAEIGPRFASFNMPNLHLRTTEAGLEDDFRPGVEVGQENEQQRIDLSNEFERQFFGDLMLFSTEELVKRANVNWPFPRETVEAVFDQKEAEMLTLYRQKHAAIVQRNRQLNEQVFKAGHWWLHAPELEAALTEVRAFIDNIERNFGEHATAWQQIQSSEHRARRKQQIVEALLDYRAERDAWDSLF